MDPFTFKAFDLKTTTTTATPTPQIKQQIHLYKSNLNLCNEDLNEVHLVNLTVMPL